jgi:dTDP-4-amino-4,6-dideoxygalactose transaminase
MPTVRRPGERAAFHSHWIFPIQVSAPDELMRFLWRKGFDATRGASSLHVVDAPSGRKELTPTQAQDAMQHLLYVPVYPEATQRDIERLAQATIEFERRNSSHVQ